MNAEIRGIIVGMVFGDAYLNVRKRTTKTGNSWTTSEMRVLHSTKQSDYCNHKAALLRKHLKRNFTVNIVRNGPGGKYKAVNFSVGHPYFKQLKRLTYPGGKKAYLRRALDMLTPEGIAIWYMDDGHARTNTGKDGWISSVSTDIATCCSELDVLNIVAFFKETYGIIFNIRYDKRLSLGNNYYIQANTKQSKEFAGLIQPYVIPSMLYKLAHVAKLDSHERQTPVGVCATCGNTVYEMRRQGLCTACYSRKYYREVARFRQGRKKSPRGWYKGDDIVQTCGNKEP